MASLLVLGGCAAPPAPIRPSPEGPLPFALPAGLDLYLPVTGDLELNGLAIELGRRLFFDVGLSRDGTRSCASCHRPELAFTDGRVLPAGADGRPRQRHVPTLVNRAYGSSHFWDGRASSLRAQVLEPIGNPDELGLGIGQAVLRLRTDTAYVSRFRVALGADVDAASLSAALAAYVASILSGDAPFDRYAAGDTAALSPEARHGRRLFIGRANCAACHVGPNFSDERFHNTGVAWRSGSPADSGRARVTGRLADLGAFKTPTLREVARTAPFMHDGSLGSLIDVVDFYDQGGHPNPHLDPEIRPLRLDPEEKQALIAFLHTLSGTVREGGEAR